MHRRSALPAVLATLALSGATAVAAATPALAQTTAPTYLTLVATGPGQNFSNRRVRDSQEVTTAFTRVRLVATGESVTGGGATATCTADACIDVTDLTFSQSTGSSQFGDTMPYGSAAGCDGPDGLGNVDLTGTPYAVAADAFMASEGGRSTSTYGEDDRVVDLTGNGSCGGIDTATPPLLPLVLLEQPAPVVPEAPVALVLPLVAVAAGAVVLRRRRGSLAAAR